MRNISIDNDVYDSIYDARYEERTTNSKLLRKMFRVYREHPEYFKGVSGEEKP